MAQSRNESASGLLKVVFLAHLVLSSWGMESPYLVPTGYLYYNLIFMISIMWAIASDNMDSVAMAFLINVASIVMDAFALSNWPRAGPSREKVYFGLAIANAVLRGITAVLLYRLFGDRDNDGVGMRGAFGDIIGVFDRSSSGKQGYQTIDGGEQGQGSSQGPPSQPQQGSSEQQQRGGGNSRSGTTPRYPSVQFTDQVSAYPMNSDV